MQYIHDLVSYYRYIYMIYVTSTSKMLSARISTP